MDHAPSPPSPPEPAPDAQPSAPDGASGTASDRLAPAPGALPTLHAPSDGGADGDAGLRDVLDALADVVFRTDRRGRWTYLNAGWERLVGRSVHASLGRSALENVHPRDRERYRAAFRELVRGERTRYELELRILRTDGPPVRASVRVASRHGPDGAVDGAIGTIRGLEPDARARHAEARLAGERALLGSILDTLPGAFLMVSPSGRLVRWNERLVQMSGLPPADLAAARALDLFAPEDRAKLRRAARRAMADGRGATEVRLEAPDGRRVPLLLHGARIRIDGVPHLLGTGLDVSERIEAEEARRSSEARLRAFFEQSPEAYMVFGLDERIQAFNTVAAERGRSVFGREMRVGGSTLDFVGAESVPEFRANVARAVAGEPVLLETEIRRDDGGSYFAEIRYYPVQDGGETLGIAFASRDVTERVRAREQIERMAYTDALTGLSNRRRLHERGAALLRAALGAPDGRAALLYLDLDRFKLVNDTLGHDAGDRLLVAVAADIARAAAPPRPDGPAAADGAGPTEPLLARLGGDEFALLLPGADAAAADAAAERLLEAVRRPFVVDGQEIRLGGSVGVALAPRHGRGLDDLLKHADIAMYQAKEGGGGLAVFDPARSPYSVERLDLEAALRRDVEGGGLLLHYQPIEALTEGGLGDVEALARWPRGEGVRSASAFIGLAEESDLIRQLDAWVLGEAVAQAARWRAAGAPRRVSVNLSARTLLRQGLVARVRAALEHEGLPPDLLCLELTESAFLHHPETAIRVLEELRALGVRLAVDDFGSGFASLTYLRRLPADRVKIDRRLLRGVGSPDDADGKDARLVQAAIELGHGLGLEVVAEGIERPEQLAWLRERGCDFAQGWWIGVPTTAEEVPAARSVRRA